MFEHCMIHWMCIPEPGSGSEFKGTGRQPQTKVEAAILSDHWWVLSFWEWDGDGGGGFNSLRIAALTY
jgi:hypothetical protein